MGARLINNPRQTNRGHIDAVLPLDIRALRKSGFFNEGQLTQCSFRYAGLSILVDVDLRFEPGAQVILRFKNGDSTTDRQVIWLTHRPTGFNGRRWYFESAKGERAEKLYLVDGRFRTRKEARLTYRSQSMGELDRLLELRRKLQAQLKGTGARGPARGRRRQQAEERLEEIEHFLTGFESGLMHRDQKKRARARERRRRSLERLEAARTAMTQRKDVQTEWVITTFRSLVDGLKAGAISPDPSPLPPGTPSSNPDPKVDIGILQRLGFVKSGKMLGDQLGWSEAWIPEPKRRLFFSIDLRDRQRPCAVFVVRDPERQTHQLFALKRVKGQFGRHEYRFICPNAGRQSTAISYSNGQFFCSS